MKKWIVVSGELYFGGIGSSFTNQGCIGWVMTRLREKAERLDLETAETVAKVVGGDVVPA